MWAGSCYLVVDTFPVRHIPDPSDHRKSQTKKTNLQIDGFQLIYIKKICEEKPTACSGMEKI